MGKVKSEKRSQDSKPAPKRGSFFIRGTKGVSKNKFDKNQAESKEKVPHGPARSDNFFVTSAEKARKTICKENRVSKRNKNVREVPEGKNKSFGRGKKAENSGTRQTRSKSNKGEVPEETKKPFDKKKWRLQKYSKKFKLQQWEDKRKKAVLREYYKEAEGAKPGFDVKKIYKQYEEDEAGSSKDPPDEHDPEEIENDNNCNTSINLGQAKNRSKQRETNLGTNKSKGFKNAQLEYKRIKEEKVKKKEELAKVKKERAESFRKYKSKKLEKFRKLNQKTKKGQPIMKHRIEMLLEQIQNKLK